MKKIMDPSELTAREKEVLLIYADCNMSANATAKRAYISCNGVLHKLYAIRRKTGKNPQAFYDLVYLVSCINGEKT